MPDTDITAWIEQLRELIASILTIDLALQAGALALALLLGAALQPFTRRLIQAFERQARRPAALRNARWADDVFAVLQGIRWPLAAYILCRLALSGLDAAGRETVVLAWATPFVVLWLVFRAFRTFFERRLAEEQADVWTRQIVRPILVGIGLLQALTLFDDIWQWGFTVRGERFTVGTIVVALVIFYIFFQFSKTARVVLGDTVLPRAGVHPTLTQIIASFTGYIVVLVGLVAALGIVGIELTTLTVILGGLSVGFGFALQDIISNFISGFILLFDRTIVPGDVVSVDDHFGRVTNVGIRATRVRTLDNVELIVPNSAFLTSTVENYSSGDPSVRIAVVVGASYDVDPRLVEKALLEAAEGMPVLDSPAPSVQFIDFGASSLDFRLLVWLANPLASAGIQSQLRYRIWERFKAHNIPIPYPQRDLHIISMPERDNGAVDEPVG